MSDAKPSRRTKKPPANTEEKQGSGSVVRVPASEQPLDLTPRQIAQRDRQQARVRARPDRPESVVITTEAGRTIAAAPSQDGGLHGAAMFDAFGTTSDPYLGNSIRTLCSLIHTEGKPTAEQFNAAVAVIAAIAPENELETTLALQIVGADAAARRCLRGMGQAEIIEQHKLYGDLANKFMRTTTGLVEALAKLRRGGEQVVRHVHVHEGGQAVVAETFNHNAGGRGRSKSVAQPHAAAIESCAEMPGADPARREMSAARDAERAVQDAWRA